MPLTLMVYLILSNHILSSAELYRSEVLPGEPVIVKFERENVSTAELVSGTGESAPEWLHATLVHEGTGSTTPLVCTRRHKSTSRKPGEVDGPLGSFNTTLEVRKAELNFTGFLVPSSQLAGEYTIRLSWTYPIGFSRSDGVALYSSKESGSCDLRIAIGRTKASGLALIADDLAKRVWDANWKGASFGGFGLAAADALFSMNAKAAFRAWQRLATEPQHNEINGVPHDYMPSFHIFEILTKREDPEAVETIALLANKVRAINPQTWENHRDEYLEVFRKMSRSKSPMVAAAAHKAQRELTVRASS